MFDIICNRISRRTRAQLTGALWSCNGNQLRLPRRLLSHIVLTSGSFDGLKGNEDQYLTISVHQEHVLIMLQLGFLKEITGIWISVIFYSSREALKLVPIVRPDPTEILQTIAAGRM